MTRLSEVAQSMLDFGEQLTGFDLAGPVMMPGWVLAVVVALVVLVCALAAVRGGVSATSSVPIAVAFIFAVTAAWVLDHLAGRDLAAERSAIEARAFELSTRALAPGSALACLEPTAGDAVQQSCDKALFASPEATAAAVSYVSAQVSLLAAGRKNAHASGLNYLKLMTPLRRNIEADRFGMVAHLFAMHDCGSGACDLFALLQDSTRVKANLADNTFESNLKAHMAEWQNAASRQAASNSAPASSAPVAITVTKPASNAFFPSASSIPPVNIMVAEPAASPQQPSHETTAAARRSGQTPTPARQAPAVELRQPALADHRPPPTADASQPQAAETRQPPAPETRAPSTAEAGQARSAPLQLVPSPQ
jgi:hypothetical protein